MFKIAIVEDEIKQASLLQEHLGEYSRQTGTEFLIKHFPDGLDFLNEYHPDYDLVFMDIDMPCLNGLEAAKRLRELDSTIVLVFVTCLAKYAIHGYEVDAMDFMVKPLYYDSFATKLERILIAASKKHGKKVIIRGGNKIISLDSKCILYVESMDHDLYIHSDDSKEIIKVRGTLASVKELLAELYFEECNKCYLVNLAKVQSVEGHVLSLENGEQLAISRAKKPDFLKKLAAYYGNWKMNMGRLQ